MSNFKTWPKFISKEFFEKSANFNGNFFTGCVHKHKDKGEEGHPFINSAKY